jgi:hypothetical protein
MVAKIKIALAALTAGFAVLAIIAVTSRATHAADEGAEIALDLSSRYQTLAGWEVTIRGWELNKAENRYDARWLDAMDEIVGDLVKEAGVNRLRLELRSNTENPVDYWSRFVAGEETHDSWAAHMYDNVNDNKDPHTVDPAGFQWSELDYKVESVVRPMQAALAARGERLFVNLCVVDFAKGNLGSLDLAQKPEEYAELVAAAFDHLKRKYDLTPDALEIILEPENSGTWRAERLGPAIKATTKRLAAAGFAPQIIAPSTVRANNAIRYFDAARRSGARIDVLSYHSYDWPKDDVRAAIAAHAGAQGAATAMLEHLNADVGEFYRDMTIANVSSWQQWGMAHFKDSGKYLLVADLSKPTGERIRLAGRTRLLSQIWRHARIGDVRVGANTADPALKPLAFVRPDGGVVISVIVEGPQAFSITGLPAGTYAVERTTGKVLAKDAGTITVGADGRAGLSMPARGVVTIAGAPRADAN